MMFDRLHVPTTACVCLMALDSHVSSVRTNIFVCKSVCLAFLDSKRGKLPQSCRTVRPSNPVPLDRAEGPSPTIIAADSIVAATEFEINPRLISSSQKMH